MADNPPVPGIDRDDPGYLRHCIGYQCEASFNVRERAPGWHWVPRMFTGALCPKHSPPLVSGEHFPSWIRGDDGKVTGIQCTCGGWSWSPNGAATLGAYEDWSWSPGTAATLGVYQERFMEHVEEAVRGNGNG